MVRLVHAVRVTVASSSVWAVLVVSAHAIAAHAEPLGSVKGTVIFEGEAPDRPKLRRDTDPYCAKIDKLAGDVIDVVCDIHPWMHAYAVVQDHAVFAVTGEDGAFELTGLAPGSYTVEAWHPTLGTRSLTVKIGKGAKAAVTARFSYKRDDLK